MRFASLKMVWDVVLYSLVHSYLQNIGTYLQMICHYILKYHSKLFVFIMQIQENYSEISAKYTLFTCFYMYATLKICWLCNFLLTPLNFIPVIQNSDVSMKTNAYEGVDNVSAEIRVNKIDPEIAISRTISWPAPIITDHFPCNNAFHIA